MSSGRTDGDACQNGSGHAHVGGRHAPERMPAHPPVDDRDDVQRAVDLDQFD